MPQDISRIAIMEGLYSLYKSLLHIEDVGGLAHVQYARLYLFSCESMHCGSHKAFQACIVQSFNPRIRQPTPDVMSASASAKTR
jgi:hypothetical protein